MTSNCANNCACTPVIWTGDNPLVQQYNIFNTTSCSFEKTNSCLMTVGAIEGPFFLRDAPVRSDVREDQPGSSLDLRLKIVNVRGCAPIRNIEVNIWSANAMGVYSGYEGAVLPPLADFEDFHHIPPVNNNRFLRGRQYTDEKGFVQFKTIYPGWYALRTVHIHIKITIGAEDVLTTQLFFPQKLNYYVQSLPPYNARHLSPDVNQTDFVLRQSSGAQGAWPRITQLGDAFTATLTVGLLLDPLYPSLPLWENPNP